MPGVFTWLWLRIRYAVVQNAGTFSRFFRRRGLTKSDGAHDAKLSASSTTDAFGFVYLAIVACKDTFFDDFDGFMGTIDETCFACGADLGIN